MKKASKKNPPKTKPADPRSLKIKNAHRASLIYGIVIGLIIGLFMGIPIGINYSPVEKETDANGAGHDQTTPVQSSETPSSISSIGFEEFLVDDSLSGMKEGIVTLVLENAGSGSINVKKVTATHLDTSIENISYYSLVSLGDRASYSFDFSEYIEGQDFWIDFEVLYDSVSLNSISTGSLFKGISDVQVSECQSASFEMLSYNYYVGRGVLSLDFRNTGSKELTIQAKIRDSEGRVSDIMNPFILEVGETRLTREVSGLASSMESLMFVSEDCPGLNEIIMIDDIAGL